MKILSTRAFSSDCDGTPVSRQLALADQAQLERLRAKPSEEAQRAYLVATGVPTIGSATAETAETAESADPLGDAWLAATAVLS